MSIIIIIAIVILWGLLLSCAEYSDLVYDILELAVATVLYGIVAFVIWALAIVFIR